VKIAEKAGRFPEEIRIIHPPPQSFRVFDDRFTGPIHGYEDARDYWESTSGLRFIPAIEVPALLINAWDDTFLSEACYPVDLARRHSRFFLETPHWGGHVGFYEANGDGAIWSEKRAFAFIDENT